MYNRDFDVWLKGYLVLETGMKPLTLRQFVIIHRHLKLVEQIEKHPDENHVWLRDVLDNVIFHSILTPAQTGKITQSIRDRYLSDYAKGLERLEKT